MVENSGPIELEVLAVKGRSYYNKHSLHIII